MKALSEKNEAAWQGDPGSSENAKKLCLGRKRRASQLPSILTLDELLAEASSAPSMDTAVEIVAACLPALRISREIDPCCSYLANELAEALAVITRRMTR